MEGTDGRTSVKPEELSTPELVGSIAGDIASLVRKEVELAQAEFKEGATAQAAGIGAFVATGVLALLALVFLAAAGAAGLDNVVAPWLSRLIVAGVLLLIAGIAVGLGRASMKRHPLAPKETARRMKEDVEWARAQLKR